MSSTPEQSEKQLYFFVRRPVLAAVISIVIVLLGTFALLGLPVARYPQITPPSVQVTATYPGATAEDVAQAVAAPIEQQLSGLDGLLYYRSSNSSSGVMNLQVFFDIGRVRTSPRWMCRTPSRWRSPSFRRKCGARAW